MNRIFSSIGMAFCAIIGVLILFNACTSLVGLVLHPAGRANVTYTLIAAAVMIPIASGLLFLAVRLRRRLRLLDAQADDPAATQ